MNKRIQRQARALARARERAGRAYLTEHAVARARELGFHETEVLACVANPENTYPSHPRYGANQRTFQRGQCCAIVESATNTVITVLLRTPRDWVHGRDTRATIAAHPDAATR